MWSKIHKIYPILCSSVSTVFPSGLFLSTVGIFCISWFLYDIRDYFIWLRNHSKKEKDSVTFNLMKSDDEFLNLCRPLEIIGSETTIIKRYFCFMTGRHTGSFFLKMGAACFCVGHIIHNGVIFARNLIQMFSKNNLGKYVFCCFKVTRKYIPALRVHPSKC